MLINSAFADATSDARIQAYKANKLIPQNIVLPTSTGAADSDEVVLFNKGALSWSSTTALSASYAEQMGISKDDWDTMLGEKTLFSEWSEYKTYNLTFSEYTQKDLDFLNAVASGEVTGAAITQEDAKSILQSNAQLLESYSHFHEDAVTTLLDVQYSGDITHYDLSNTSIFEAGVIATIEATSPGVTDITLTQSQFNYLLSWWAYETIEECYGDRFTFHIK